MFHAEPLGLALISWPSSDAPAAKIVVCSAQIDGKNKLYFGDNLSILREHVADAGIDLIYLDPPFNSNANYNVLLKRNVAQRGGTASEWRLAGEVTFHPPAGRSISCLQFLTVSSAGVGPAAHGRHPHPSERAGLISDLLRGEKVLRYEADEESLRSESRSRELLTMKIRITPPPAVFVENEFIDSKKTADRRYGGVSGAQRGGR